MEGIVSYFDEEHHDGKPKDVGDGKVYKEYLMTLTAEVKRKNISWLDKVKDEEADFLVILGKNIRHTGNSDSCVWEYSYTEM